MTEHGHSHISKYLKVFAALMVLTIVTVAISKFHFGIALAITAAMLVAITKGSLVAAYFMHLVGEKKAIFIVLAVTLIFFALLLAAPTLVLLDDYRMEP